LHGRTLTCRSISRLSITPLQIQTRAVPIVPLFCRTLSAQRSINLKKLRKVEEKKEEEVVGSSNNILEQTIEELESKQRQDLQTLQTEKRTGGKVTYKESLTFKNVRRGYAAKGRYQSAQEHPAYVKKPKRFRAQDEAWAKLNKYRYSPRKMSMIVHLMRKKPFAEAYKQIQLCGKAVAPDLLKLLISARANAENNYNMDRSRLIVSEVLVSKDVIYERIKPMARGRMGLMHRRHCRITVILKEMPEEHFMNNRQKRISNDRI